MIIEKLRSGLKTAADKIADLNEYKFYGETTVKLSSEDKINNKKSKCVDTAIKTDVSALEIIIAGTVIAGVTAAAAYVVKKCIEKKYLGKLKKKYVLVPVDEYYGTDDFDDDGVPEVNIANDDGYDENEEGKDGIPS